MPRIIKNDTDSYIMKNGVAYGDGLTGYVLKDGMYYGYMSNPTDSYHSGLCHWEWSYDLTDDYAQYSTSSLDNFNIFHIMIFNGGSSTLAKDLTPVHVVMSAELFNNSNIDNPIVCTFRVGSADAFRSFYMYKVSSTSIAARRDGDKVSSLIYINFYGETV